MAGAGASDATAARKSSVPANWPVARFGAGQAVAPVTRTRAASLRIVERAYSTSIGWGERHDARAAGESRSALLVEGARSMILGQRPEVCPPGHSSGEAEPERGREARFRCLGSRTPASHTRCAGRRGRQRLLRPARRPRTRCTSPPTRVGECGEPVRANRVIRELVEARREDVPKASHRRSARDPETELGVLHHGAHDSHRVSSPSVAHDVFARS